MVLAANYRTYGYAREEGSPTWEAFEAAIGALEGGVVRGVLVRAWAAIASVLEPLPVGARVVGPAVGYTVTRGLLAERAAAGRIELASVDLTDTDAVLRACEGAALLWVETPTNPMIGIAELDRLCEGAHAAGAEVVVDATFATPLLQRPLELGADVVVHSATKFIGGHSDLLLGVASARTPERARRAAPRARHARRHAGGARGLPRAARAAHAAGAARARRRRPRRCSPSGSPHTRRSAPSTTPGCASDPGHERAARLMDGFGAMLAFETAGGAAAADAVCERVRVVVHATSLGGVETLIERRARNPGEVAPGGAAAGQRGDRACGGSVGRPRSCPGCGVNGLH